MSPNKQSRTAHCCDYIVREDTWNAPKSMCRRYFARDGIYINFWNAPKSNSFSFFSFFCSKVDHVLNFLKCPIFESILVRMLLMFRKFRAWKSGAFQKINTWSTFEQKKEKNWNWSISGRFKNLCKWHHVQNISSTYFLGHFKHPPVMPKFWFGVEVEQATSGSQESLFIYWSGDLRSEIRGGDVI